MGLALLIISFIYFYNIFLFIPNRIIPLVNINTKFIYLILIQGIFISIIEKNREKYRKLYALLILLIILPSILIDIKICFLQLLFLYSLQYSGLDEKSSLFIMINTIIWLTANLLFLSI
ncbi:MAG: hypothetical protein N2169_05165 [bacterium]|nr:hypothetical protein [bacterium]